MLQDRRTWHSHSAIRRGKQRACWRSCCLKLPKTAAAIEPGAAGRETVVTSGDEGGDGGYELTSPLRTSGAAAAAGAGGDEQVGGLVLVGLRI
jgi:hypothetical protein